MMTPIRQDGTKTPLREPKKDSRSKAREISSESPSEAAQEQGKSSGSGENTVASLRVEFLRDRLERKTWETNYKKDLKNLAATVNTLEYDVDSQGRSQCYSLYKMLNDDQQRAAKILHLEFPKEATVQDRMEFCNWILDEAQVQDKVEMSFINHRGEVARAGRLTFTSSYHRSRLFSHWAETWSRQNPLYFWSTGTGRTWHNIVLRKELSEDARIRGRYLKAAMDGLNLLPNLDDCKKQAAPCSHEDHRPEFYPKWADNSIRDTGSGDFLVWCHFSYTKSTVAVFVDESCFDTVKNNLAACLERIMYGKGEGKGEKGDKGKGDGKGKEKEGKNKGKGDGKGKGKSSKGHKGLLAAMGNSDFDARLPFWIKFIDVRSWTSNEELQTALQEEKDSKAKLGEVDMQD